MACFTPAQHDVESKSERPIRLRQVDIEFRNQPLPRFLVRQRIHDRIEREQRIAREIHLRHQARRERRAEKRKMNVRRPPRVRMIPPRIRSRLDRGEAVVALRVRQRSPRAREIRIERRGMLVGFMPVASRGVALPDLDQRVRHGTPVVVDHAPGHDDALADRLALTLPRQIVVRFLDVAVPEDRPGHLGKRVRQQNQRIARAAQHGRAIRRIQQRRLRALRIPAVWRNHYGRACPLDRTRCLGCDTCPQTTPAPVYTSPPERTPSGVSRKSLGKNGPAQLVSALRIRSYVVESSSGSTRVSPTTVMKFASPAHRGSTCICRCPVMPAPAARPRFMPRL